jgi:hypothetical protein
MKYTKIPYKSWAVRLTTENKEVIKEYFKQHRSDFDKFRYDCLNSYYGIDIYGNLENYSNRAGTEFAWILSNKEFIHLIANKEPDYEIY